ncbi:hypothetical protein AALA80_04440 [Oscillospiraceae bacterium 50-60]
MDIRRFHACIKDDFRCKVNTFLAIFTIFVCVNNTIFMYYHINQYKFSEILRRNFYFCSLFYDLLCFLVCFLPVQDKNRAIFWTGRLPNSEEIVDFLPEKGEKSPISAWDIPRAGGRFLRFPLGDPPKLKETSTIILGNPPLPAGIMMLLRSTTPPEEGSEWP